MSDARPVGDAPTRNGDGLQGQTGGSEWAPGAPPLTIIYALDHDHEYTGHDHESLMCTSGSGASEALNSEALEPSVLSGVARTAGGDRDSAALINA